MMYRNQKYPDYNAIGEYNRCASKLFGVFFLCNESVV